MNVKTHKVSKMDFRKAGSYRSINGFWNPGVEPIKTACGTEPLSITWNWDTVDCKKCLKAKKN